jgi:hypothetical protein
MQAAAVFQDYLTTLRYACWKWTGRSQRPQNCWHAVMRMCFCGIGMENTWNIVLKVVTYGKMDPF